MKSVKKLIQTVYFPWIHPKEWAVIDDDHIYGMLDMNQTAIHLQKNQNHIQVFLATPNTSFGPYDDDFVIIETVAIPLNNTDCYTALGMLVNKYYGYSYPCKEKAYFFLRMAPEDMSFVY